MNSQKKKSYQSSLRSCCHISTGCDGDNFVGIKGDADGVKIFFPIGYRLPNDDNDLRNEIRVLLYVLHDHEKKEQELSKSTFSLSTLNEQFPLQAYMDVITNFLENNCRYYIESEHSFEIRPQGKIDWSKTVKRCLPILQNNTDFVFDKFIVRNSEANAEKLITRIHKYCVFESFSKLGWLFLSTLPEPPDISYNKHLFVDILQKKFCTTNNDRLRKLFRAMLDIVLGASYDAKPTFSYGTDFFERIWESMIDKAFGSLDKKNYFPRTKWLLRSGHQKSKSPLEPDSIMQEDGKIYVLDAKYYRFDSTGNPEHLPDSSSINKQITYGEYIYQNYNIDHSKLFNAFILPADIAKYESADSKITCNVGEAVGDWKSNNLQFQRIQGVLLDTKYLMHRYKSISSEDRKTLCKSIEVGVPQIIL